MNTLHFARGKENIHGDGEVSEVVDALKHDSKICQCTKHMNP